MENKLYYKDPYIASFSTKLITHEKDEQGKWYAILEETAFYPTGGGQPHDEGLINGVKVIDVEEVDGEIRHYLEERLQEVARVVKGEVNWERRFDHMQQHAGQHILSAAFEALFDLSTIGFHLGKEFLTIDLDTEELTEQQIMKAEKLANQIIMESRPIETKWVTSQQLSMFPLRKQPTVTENIRLVIIPEFDYNGCGGTHPKTTSEVGSIKLLSWERQKGKVRLQFICGDRVIRQLHEKNQVLNELTGLLNAPEKDLPLAAKRIIENGREQDKLIAELQEALISCETKELLEKANKVKDRKVVSKVFQRRSIQEMQKLARIIANKEEKAIILFVNETDEKLQFVCARGSAISISMKQIAATLLTLINGKGGGNDSFAQGGGDAMYTGEQLLKMASEKLDKENENNNI